MQTHSDALRGRCDRTPFEPPGPVGTEPALRHDYPGPRGTFGCLGVLQGRAGNNDSDKEGPGFLRW